MRTKEKVKLYVVRDVVDGSIQHVDWERSGAEVTCESLAKSYAVDDDGNRLWNTKPVLEEHSVALGRGRRLRVTPKADRDRADAIAKPPADGPFGVTMTAAELGRHLRVGPEWLERYGITPHDHDPHRWYSVAPFERALADPPARTPDRPMPMTLYVVVSAGREEYVKFERASAEAYCRARNSLQASDEPVAWIEERVGVFKPEEVSPR